MKQIYASLVAIGLSLSPVSSQETEENWDKGLGLLQEGTRLLLEGLMEELAPALEELEGFLLDLNMYYPPEILPNGDIIIRRRVPLTPQEQEELDL